MAAHPEVLERFYLLARSQWVDLPLEQALFRKHVERLHLEDQAVAERAEDLFVVAAALEGVPNGTALLERYLVVAVSVARRVDSAPAFIDEVTQELRVSLLTGAAPKLATYAATGALLDWLRVVVVRLALNLKRRNQAWANQDVPAEVMDDDQDAGQFKSWYLDDMHGALEKGFEALSPRERTLMRMHFVDGLNIERIGVIYGVHRATVARWLVTIRRQLFEQTKDQLAMKHGLTTADVRSLYRVMERDVHISMSRVLAG